MWKIAFACAVSCIVLTSCAKPPKDISASYVDPAAYRNMSCDQLQAEAIVLANQARMAVGQQQSKADMDATMVGVGIIVAWPALLFTSRDTTGEATIANLRGHMNAIELASSQKSCGFIIEKV
ncbi:MAG: hypothetical protein KKH72_05840 [Alphaproteobacteria bacterium]|nr:hypothetical protein [Alphaproteobacteria bacterium]